MRVYLLQSGHDEEIRTHGIFSTLEKAKAEWHPPVEESWQESHPGTYEWTGALDCWVYRTAFNDHDGWIYEWELDAVGPVR